MAVRYLLLGLCEAFLVKSCGVPERFEPLWLGGKTLGKPNFR